LIRENGVQSLGGDRCSDKTLRKFDQVIENVLKINIVLLLRSYYFCVLR
jgi:hypothetical protein